MYNIQYIIEAMVTYNRNYNCMGKKVMFLGIVFNLVN